MSLGHPIHDKEAAWAAFHAFRDGRPSISTEVRLAVFEAANWRCCYCGVRLWSNSPSARESQALFANEARISVRFGRAMKTREATIEHIQKRSDGGSDDRDNLAAACAWCNHSRGDWGADSWFEQVAFMKKWGTHPHFERAPRASPWR